jgi:hypothetical protein
MLLEAIETDGLTDLEELVAGLFVAVDGEVLAELFRLRDRLLAKAMAPLREFDELQLYQLSKASSTKQFLERAAGLSPGDAGSSVSMARKLRSMPLTEAAWLAGTLPSGHVRAIVAPRVAERYAADEGDILAIIDRLTPKEVASAMASCAIHAHALVDDDESKPPREDEFFHSATLGGRYLSRGAFGAVTGAVIAKAVALAESDNPRDDDTRSPAQRRGEALADVCGFYLDYQNRITVDPDAAAPIVAKKRNWPQLIGVATTDEIAHRAGGATPRRAPHRPPRPRSALLHRATPTVGPRRTRRHPRLPADAGIGHRRPLRCRGGA